MLLVTMEHDSLVLENLETILKIKGRKEKLYKKGLNILPPTLQNTKKERKMIIYNFYSTRKQRKNEK